MSLWRMTLQASGRPRRRCPPNAAGRRGRSGSLRSSDGKRAASSSPGRSQRVAPCRRGAAADLDPARAQADHFAVRDQAVAAAVRSPWRIRPRGGPRSRRSPRGEPPIAATAAVEIDLRLGKRLPAGRRDPVGMGEGQTFEPDSTNPAGAPARPRTKPDWRSAVRRRGCFSGSRPPWECTSGGPPAGPGTTGPAPVRAASLTFSRRKR